MPGTRQAVITKPGAESFLPRRGGLAALRAAADGCRACELWSSATQTVFGEGPSRSVLMLVGEQPGDREDLSGHPFVGPAGRVLDSGLELAGIDRESVYLTNAVKHFRWKARGKRRLHERPARSHVVACRPWLRAELERVRPRVLVLMGAIAAQSLLGPELSVTRERGVLPRRPRGCPPSSSRCIPPRSCADPTRNGARACRISQPTCAWLRRSSETAVTTPSE